MLMAQFVRNLQRFRLVTFDITDTLIKLKTEPGIQYAKTARSFGVENLDHKALTKCFRQEFKAMVTLHPNFGRNTENMNWNKWWLQLVINIFHCVDSTIPVTKLNVIANTLIDEYRSQDCWTVVDGANELIAKIKKIGKRVGVISNFDPSLRQILIAMKLDEFDFVLNSYDCQVQKPNSKIFQIPLAQYGIAANEALHIGNLYDVDYIGARKSGWSSLLVTEDIPKASELHPTHVCENLRALIKSLETNTIEW